MKKLTLPLLLLVLLLAACNKDSMDNPMDDPTTSTDQGLGWMPDEDASGVPNAINLSFGNGNLPEKISLKQHTPPVGQQGNKGTCVAFALGYNLKTMHNAIDNKLTTPDLSTPSMQTSPTDLFLAIPGDKKVANCAGTHLHYALDVIQNRGVATMAVAPYSDQTIGDCSQSTDPAADQSAPNNKIEYYRQINIDVNEFKSQLADNRPIGIGAILSDNYMNWNSDDVLSSHTTYDIVGQHAGHAMTIVGYDDSKGPNGAFEVVNSWGESWGNQGFIWIDYNFMTGGTFADVAFIVQNSKTQYDPNAPDTIPNNTTGVDLAPYMAGDFGTSSTRELWYDVYNIGTEPALASKDWTTAYILVNAFDINDYEIILWDYYSDDFGNPGEYDIYPDGLGQHSYYNHFDIPAGSSSRYAYEGIYTWTQEYTIPNITGYYYPALITDVTEVISESDEQNNIFILSDEYGDPIYIENGVPYGFVNKKKPETENDFVSAETVEKQAKMTKAPYEKGGQNRNAYRKDEIKESLSIKWKNGSLLASQVSNSGSKQ